MARNCVVSLLHLRERGRHKSLRKSINVDKELKRFAEESLLCGDLKQQKICAKDQLASNGTKSTYLLAVSCDKTMLASCHGDHSIVVTHIHTGHVLRRLRAHPRTPWAMAFHPNIPHLLASGCLAGHVIIWDLKSLCSSKTRIESETAIACVCFHPTLPIIAIAVSNKIVLRDWQNSSPIDILHTASKKERIRYVSFDALGTVMYTAITNVERVVTPGVRPMPTIMPQSCQRMLDSRNDLLTMRHDLQRRHAHLQARYNRLLQSYHELRAAHPQIEDIGPEPPPPPPQLDAGSALPSPLFQQHLIDRERQTAQSVRNARSDDTGPMANLMFRRPPRSHGAVPPRWSSSPQAQAPAFVTPVMDANSLRSTTASRPLSPISLEHLEDAVGYAVQLTSESMRQFREFHEASMDIIRRSYAQLFQASQQLLDRFQETYDSILRMNERIEERQALASTSQEFCGARALLGALVRMQRILMHHNYPYGAPTRTRENMIRPLVNEITTLLQVFDTMLAVDSESLPRDIETDLRDGRQRMQDMIDRLQNVLNQAGNAQISHDELSMHQQLSTEIDGFQHIMESWKHAVLARGREEHAQEDAPSTSTAAQRVRSPSPNQTPSTSAGRRRVRDDNPEDIPGQPPKRKRLQTTESAPLPPPRPPTPIPDMHGPEALFVAESSDSSDTNDIDLHSPMDPGPSMVTTSSSNRRRQVGRSLRRQLNASSERNTELFMYVPGNDRAGESRYVRIGHLAPQPLQDHTFTTTNSGELEDDQDRASSQQLHIAINRAIAGALIGSGDMAVANNILDLTFRIQNWPFHIHKLPNLTNPEENVLVNRCKLHNDGSISMSPCQTMMACFVENINPTNPVWASTMLRIISLTPQTRGQILYQETFGPNAMCLDFSPTGEHIVVGLATRNYLRLTHSAETYMQIYKLDHGHNRENKLELVRGLESVLPLGTRPVDLQQEMEMRNSSIFCARWLPTPGLGFAYGTNKGHVFMLKTSQLNAIKEASELGRSNSSVREEVVNLALRLAHAENDTIL